MEAVGALLVVVGFFVFLFWAMRMSDKRQHYLSRDGILVDDSPRRAVDGLTSHLVAQGYTVTQRSDYTATLTRQKRPDYVMTVGFLIAGIILFPIGLLLLGAYLLYFPVVKPRAAASIVASREAGGGTRLALSGDDRRVRKDLKEWAEVVESPQPT